MVLGEEGNSDPFFITVTISAGGVLIATLVGLWIKYKSDQKKKNGKE